MYVLALVLVFGLTDVPVPNLTAPVDYSAWLNEQFTPPDQLNAAPLLLEAVREMTHNDALSELAQDPLTWPERLDSQARTWVEQNRLALQALADAGRRKHCYFAIPTGTQPHDHLLPLGELQMLAHCQLLQLRFAIVEGDMETLIACLEQNADLTRLLRDHPTLATQQVAGAIETVRYRWVRFAIAQQEVDPTAFAKAFRRIDRGTGSPRTWRGAQAAAMSQLQELAREHAKAEASDTFELAAMHEKLLAYQQHLLRLARKSYANLRLDEQALIDEFGLTPVKQLVAGNLRHHQLAYAQRCDRATTRAVVVVELYRAQHGRWPDSLEQARGREPKSAFADPFTDDMLIYRNTEAGPLLYSVWTDGEDNGGSPIVERIDDAGDYVVTPLTAKQ